jgi:hypothetical protein
VIWVCVKTCSVMSDLSLCENVFCYEWPEFLWQHILLWVTWVYSYCLYHKFFHTNSDHSLQNTFSHKLRSLITEYVFTQTQITHYRISFHTNSEHSLQNTFSHKLRSLITEHVFTQTEITHYRIRLHTNSDHSLQNTFSHKLRSLITEYVFTQTQTSCIARTVVLFR